MSVEHGDQNPTIIVGLISCRNPTGLTKLIETLHVSERKLKYRIIVVDNDRGGEALAAVQTVMKVHPDIEIRGVLEPVPGIPAARSRLLAEAMRDDFDFVAMLDDDEFPADGWLCALVDEALRSDAAVVGGPVEAQLEQEPKEPIRVSDYAKAGGRLNGGAIIVESTANLLLRRDVLVAFRGNWFSDRFALTGGEDTEFLRRTRSRGFKHAIAPAALVYEDIPVARITVAWHRRRSYRKGNGLASIRILEQGVAKALVVETVNSAGLLGRILLTLCRGGCQRRARFLAVLDFDRVRGKIGAFLGRSFHEYARENYR